MEAIMNKTLITLTISVVVGIPVLTYQSIQAEITPSDIKKIDKKTEINQRPINEGNKPSIKVENTDSTAMLDPFSIPKYKMPLVIPPEMPKHKEEQDKAKKQGKNKEKSKDDSDYSIALRQFEQQILPEGLPKTTVWGYGAIDYPGTVAEGGTFNYPAFTVEVESDKTTRVKWINDLVEDGQFLPHLFADSLDQGVHWANPSANNCLDGNDRTDCATSNTGDYQGPVPMVTHVHGAHVGAESDGYPEAWWLPKADNIPTSYAKKGRVFKDATGKNSGEEGYANYEYPNDQAESTLWYHDHSLGITRLNVYAGMEGYWIIRDPEKGQEKDLNLPRPSPRVGDEQGNNPFGKYYEIPLLIQDRSFKADGSLFYPNNRAFFEAIEPDQLQVKLAPDSDILSRWNPEAFFNTMVVNGRTWPYLDVDKGRYRFRIINGAQSRFLNLAMHVVNKDGSLGDEVPFYQIGGDQGLLSDVVKIEMGKQTTYDDETNKVIVAKGPAKDAPHPEQGLLLTLSERSDVIVDFSNFAEGTRIRMINTAPDEPFGGFPLESNAMPETTGQVMEFVVSKQKAPEFADPTQLSLKDYSVGKADNVRRVSLNEVSSDEVCVKVEDNGAIKQINSVQSGNEFLKKCEEAQGEPFGPRMALLGTVSGVGPEYEHEGLAWGEGITENPSLNSTEEWEIFNFTEDAHPIHIHLVNFEVIDRINTDGSAGHGVLPSERGPKDVVIAYPGEITKVRAKFDKAGLYVWHCHILEHEDNEMMRPFCVGEAGKDCDAALFDPEDLIKKPTKDKQQDLKTDQKSSKDKQDSHDDDYDKDDHVDRKSFLQQFAVSTDNNIKK